MPKVSYFLRSVHLRFNLTLILGNFFCDSRLYAHSVLEMNSSVVKTELSFLIFMDTELVHLILALDRIGRGASTTYIDPVLKLANQETSLAATQS
jgi:hypothetical protein